MVPKTEKTGWLAHANPKRLLVRLLPKSATPDSYSSVVVGVSALLVTGAAVLFAFGASKHIPVAAVDRENRLLKAELRRLEARLADVDASITTLAEKDERFRLLAGMARIDEEVLQVGVGGPGLETVGEDELWSLNPEASEAAFTIRYDLDVLERKAGLLEESMDDAVASMEDELGRLDAIPSILPTGGVLSSQFSYNRFHPIYHRVMAHYGVDIRAPSGTPIVAAAKGVVRSASWTRGYGYTVIIDHGYGYTTLYGHASKLLVSAGRKVNRGDLIALVGSTGISTSSHLHYEVHVNGRPVNPMNYVLGRAIP